MLDGPVSPGQFLKILPWWRFKHRLQSLQATVLLHLPPSHYNWCKLPVRQLPVCQGLSKKKKSYTVSAYEIRLFFVVLSFQSGQKLVPCGIGNNMASFQ